MLITLLDENGQSAESVVVKSPEGKEIGTFTVDKETGVVTFTPTITHTNGTVAETPYTPKITQLSQLLEPATPTDIQSVNTNRYDQLHTW